MRFITEFEIPASEHINIENWIKMCERTALEDLSTHISNQFGWQAIGQTTLKGPVTERRTLEIEAFPMDKWVEFRDKIRRFVVSGETDVTKIWLSILELESFGNPAGAAKEL